MPDSFDIDQRTGQIKVKRGTTLDYEATDGLNGRRMNNCTEVTVTATDPSGDNEKVTSYRDHRGTEPVNETPVLTLPEAEQ